MTPTDPRREAFEKVADELVKMTFSTPPHIKYVTDARNELLRLYDEALLDARRLREFGGVMTEKLFEDGLPALTHNGHIVEFNENGDLLCGWPEDANEDTKAEAVFDDDDFEGAFAWLAASSTTDKGESNG